MKGFKKILFPILLLGISNLSAQLYTIKGHVYDLESHKPLENASIITLKDSISVNTNQIGFFVLQVPKSSGILKISASGFTNLEIKFEGGKDLEIQMKPDATLINEVRISGYGTHQKVKETAGAIAVLSGKEIQKGSGISMQNAMNSIPGVRMDQSSLSDAKISIRGDGVRAQYGIRDIKIYVNEIPLTEVDGTSRIEGLDIHDLGQAEIIRGPASSIYGGGTAGVINFKLDRATYQEESLEASGTVGSFGLFREGLIYRNGSNKMNSYVSLGNQFLKGYRDHNEDKRQFFTANFQFFPSEKRKITVLLTRTRQETQIAGALTQTEMNENRRQASVINLDKKAGRYQTWTRVGVGQQYDFNTQFSNSTSIYTYFYDLNHPLPYAYIRNFYQSYGGRTKFDYKSKLFGLTTNFILGAEFARANVKGTQFVNNHGEEGNVKSNNQLENTSYSLFIQSQTKLSGKTIFTIGANYSGLKYDITDFLNPTSTGIKNFNGQISPRIALSYNFGELLSLHGSVSWGFSPPTSTEINDENGYINKNLQAQKAVNYEINAKGNLFHSRLAYDLSFFKMKINGELIPQEIRPGITVYNNSGKTNHSGIELSLAGYIIRQNDDRKIKILRTNFAATYSHFRFEDYKIKDKNNQILSNFEGNQLTGIAPWTFSGNISLEIRNGFYSDFNFYYSDRLPLNDENTVYNAAWSVSNFDIGYRKSLGKQFVVDLSAGLDNIFNKKYSSNNAINAVGYGKEPAYFNPSPARSFYAGIKIKYLLTKN
ncbi:TonB-dependent receptor [Halpernia sp.]|uniref:TonB-dependent receptor n=1 Tax=Halpernia sp. TaxID=2782209 RepID=UPI003A946CD7